jgi:hypothetical protein
MMILVIAWMSQKEVSTRFTSDQDCSGNRDLDFAALLLCLIGSR